MSDAEFLAAIDAIYRKWPAGPPRIILPLAFGIGRPGYARYRLGSDGEYHLYGYRYMP